jgi:hypothetical protein
MTRFTLTNDRPRLGERIGVVRCLGLISPAPSSKPWNHSGASPTKVRCHPVSDILTGDAFKKIDGKWLIAHTHVSFPVDMRTGKADMESKP